MNWRFWEWGRQAAQLPAAPAPPPEPPAPPRRPMRVSHEAAAKAAERPQGERPNPFRLPTVVPGVIPASVKNDVDANVTKEYAYAKMAADEAIDFSPYAYAISDVYAEGLAFMGYPLLAQLTQRAEYRRPAEILAKEMTRKWITLQSTGAKKRPPKPKPPAPPAQMPPAAAGGILSPAQAQDFAPGVPTVPPEGPSVPPNGAAGTENGAAGPGSVPSVPPEPPQAEEPEPDPKAAKLVIIKAELERLGAQDVFRRAIECDGFFGRAQIYIDTGNYDPEEIKVPLSDTLEKMSGWEIQNLRVIEPIWTYPNNYNSNKPLQPDFYKPTAWFVLGQEVHSSRLMTIISREVPDMLKPAYAFGGLPLSQLMKPYVDNWLRTRQSVSDLLHAFTVMVLKTDMSSVMGGADGSGTTDSRGSDLFTRVDLFNRIRDNRGTMVVDKDREDFANVSAPLGSLDHLQAQSQEHMSAASCIPLVKLTGITPSGLNASSEGEIRVFNDWIESEQNAVIKPHLDRLIRIIQLQKFGEIDNEITYKFNALETQNDSEIAIIGKTEADTDAVYIDKGVLDPIEVRQRLATQQDSPYASIDVSDVPEPPQPPGGDPFGGGLPPDAEGEGPALPGAQTGMPVPRETSPPARPRAADAGDVGGGGGPTPVR